MWQNVLELIRHRVDCRLIRNCFLFLNKPGLHKLLHISDCYIFNDIMSLTLCVIFLLERRYCLLSCSVNYPNDNAQQCQNYHSCSGWHSYYKHIRLIIGVNCVFGVVTGWKLNKYCCTHRTSPARRDQSKERSHNRWNKYMPFYSWLWRYILHKHKTTFDGRRWAANVI